MNANQIDLKILKNEGKDRDFKFLDGVVTAGSATTEFAIRCCEGIAGEMGMSRLQRTPLIFVLWVGSVASQLLTPGTMAPYAGRGDQRRRVGYVREPAEGFFVAGSSIKEMNGVYKKVEELRGDLGHTVHYAYRKWPYGEADDFHGWMMVLAAAPEDGSYKIVGRKKTEWLFIDSNGIDRFGHEGDTVIPGCCERWQHLHRSKHDQSQPTAGTGTAVAKADEDDDSELPWQVIFIGDPNMVENLRRQQADWEAQAHRARIGAGLHRPAGCRDPAACQQTGPPAEAATPLEAAAAMDEGDWDEAVRLYGEAAERGCGELCASENEREWWQATALLGKAKALRVSGKRADGLDAVTAALSIFPRYKDAMVERGRAMLDCGQFHTAVVQFEQVLYMDREHPDILRYLAEAHAAKERLKLWMEEDSKRDQAGYIAGPEEEKERARDAQRLEETAGERDLVAQAILRSGFRPQPQPAWGIDHYSTLGVSRDATPAQIKKGYKDASRQMHPDKQGGSNRKFQMVAEAYRVLSAEEDGAREEYDTGGDVPRGLRNDGSQGPTLYERVERHYFLDRYQFEPFGDSLEKKKQKDAEKEEKRLRDEMLNKDLPEGTYRHSCWGCGLHAQRHANLKEQGPMLRCTQCLDGTGGKRGPVSIMLRSCGEGAGIENENGNLVCGRRPQIDGGGEQQGEDGEEDGEGGEAQGAGEGGGGGDDDASEEEGGSEEVGKREL